PKTKSYYRQYRNKATTTGKILTVPPEALFFHGQAVVNLLLHVFLGILRSRKAYFISASWYFHDSPHARVFFEFAIIHPESVFRACEPQTPTGNLKSIYFDGIDTISRKLLRDILVNIQMKQKS